MAKDEDHDLIDKMNNAFSEEMQESLEKVLSVKLSPIVQILELLQKGQQELLKRQETTEKRLSLLEKGQERHSRAIKKLQRTVDVGFKTFDRQDMQIWKRVERIEKHLGLPKFE